jgi:hypothetical protein
LAVASSTGAVWMRRRLTPIASGRATRGAAGDGVDVDLADTVARE